MKELPSIIEQSAKSPLGIFALMIVLIAGLAYRFFRNRRLNVQLLIFILLFAGVCAYGYALLREQAFRRPLEEHHEKPQGSNSTQVFRLTFKTGDKDDAGTDADVFVILFGTEGITPEFAVIPPENAFERGHPDSVNVTVPHIGRPTKIQVRHNNAHDYSGWYLDWVDVEEQSAHTLTHFPVHSWLSTDEPPNYKPEITVEAKDE